MSAAQEVETALGSIASQVCSRWYVRAASRASLLTGPVRQVPGLRGVFVSDRDGVPILCHSSLPPQCAPRPLPPQSPWPTASPPVLGPCVPPAP
jgi:hypothetical protein